MVVKIRLHRVGKKNQPIFRIVAVDSRKKLKAEPLEVLGIYDPVKKNVNLDIEKYQKLIKNGALVSETVLSLYKKIIKKKKVESEIISAITSK